MIFPGKNAFQSLGSAPDSSHRIHSEWLSIDPISPCLCTLPAPSLMDECITSPGRLLVGVLVNTSHRQLLYYNAALKRKSCWKDVTFQQSKTRWKRVESGNLLVPVAIWSSCLILMVTGIISQGKAVCKVYFSMTAWLGRARSSGKPYREGDQEVKDHCPPPPPTQRRAAVTPRGEGLKWKGSPKSYPDPYHLLPSKNVSGSYSESKKKKKANTKPKLKPYDVLYKALIRVLGLMNTKHHKLFLSRKKR